MIKCHYRKVKMVKEMLLVPLGLKTKTFFGYRARKLSYKRAKGILPRK